MVRKKYDQCLIEAVETNGIVYKTSRYDFEVAKSFWSFAVKVIMQQSDVCFYELISHKQGTCLDLDRRKIAWAYLLRWKMIRKTWLDSVSSYYNWAIKTVLTCRSHWMMWQLVRVVVPTKFRFTSWFMMEKTPGILAYQNPPRLTPARGTL